KQVGWLELVSHPLRDKQGTIRGVIEQICNVTEKRKVEEELKEREAHFRLLAESNPTVILIYQDDRIVYANPATEKLTGYSREELLGMPLLKLVHPDFVNLAQEKIRRKQENLPTEKQHEIKVITKDNQERWVFLYAETIPYRGKWAGLVSVLDVTEQKRIQERNQHLNLLLQAIRNVNQLLARQRIGNLSLSKITQEMTQNGAYTSFFIFLFPSEEKPGQKFFSKIQPDILESLIPILQEKISLPHQIYSFASLPNIPLPPTEGLLTTTITYQKKILGLMGATMPLEFLSSPQEKELFLELGDDIAFALHNFTLQIRERKIQKLLEENEQKFRTMVERLPLGIVIIQNGIPVYTNPLFENLVEEHQESFLRELLQLDFKEPESEFPFVTEDKEPRWFLVHKTQIQHQGKDATLFSLMDITEKKRDEELIQYLASYDSLTGLYNRGFFEKEMQKLDQPDNLPLSIIMGDLNGLKLLNDAFGHEEGDQMLCRAAQIFKKICPPESLIARFGGDEFIALLPRTSHEKAQKIANQIQAAFVSEPFHSIPVSISLGFGTKVDETQNIPDILRIAENWMYQKKSVDGVSFRLQTFHFLKKVLREVAYEGEEHYQRIKKWALLIAQSLDLSEREREDLALLAEFHDIGKVAIPKEIWQKPGPLTEEEWDKAKKHSEIGFRVAQAIAELAPIANLVLSHHEWYNGQGYPRGLKGEVIPLLDRILAVCDAFDVMISGRPYKKSRTREEAIEELKRCAGTQFDPHITEIFVRLLTQENLEK
ncbi:MAG: sensor domain-containing diguanylate cyclase/phosphohydrolase, partial [Candidatus Caldatribacteriaceae bacterium]